MFKWRKETSTWRVRWACHCGAVYNYFGIMENWESKEAPDPGHICIKCGCKDSHYAEKGRYEWESAPFRNDRNRVWVPWKKHHCDHANKETQS